MLGYGTWGIGGLEYGPLKKNQAIDLLNHSYKKGIRFFDTAPLYGNGKVLKIISEFIKKKNRKNFILCSKCGMKPHTGFKMLQDFSEKFIKNDCIKTLEILKTQYLDIMLMHSPDINIIDKKEAINSLLKLKNQNLVKKIGISVRSPSDIKKFGKLIKNFDYVEFNFNLLDQRALEDDTFNILKKFKINSICRTPLGFGFLSDKDIKKKNLTQGDHRLNWSSEQFENWNFYKKFFYFYQLKYNLNSLSELAILFCLSNNFEFVIPGMMSFKEIDLNIKTSKLKKINQKDLKDIFKMYKLINDKIFVQKRVRS